MRRRSTISIAALLLCASCNASFLTDRGGDPVLSGDASLVWTASDQTWTEMMVVDSLLVYGTLDGYVVARDRFTGAERWRFATGTAGQPSGSVGRSLRLVGDVLVWTQRNAYALDVNTGDVRWQLQPPGSAFTGFGPAADSANVYLYRGRLVAAVRAVDGQTVWEDSSAAYDSPTIIRVQAAHGRLLTSRNAWQTGDPQVVVMDAETGVELWNAWPMPATPWPDEERCCLSIALDEAVVATLSFTGKLEARSVHDGRQLWATLIQRPSFLQTVALVDNLAIVSSSSLVTAYDRLTGEQRWEFSRTRSGTDPFIAVDGDRLGFCFQGTGTAIIDRRTGAALLEIEREPRNASRLGALRCLMGVGIKDDWLYHGTADGEIVGIRWGAGR